ncbi:hypothetical protein SUGI_0947890 [Cryptomeria japonica]|nr:hypothetical protein SUGI_0947890 [Cryptomeria japonica]
MASTKTHNEMAEIKALTSSLSKGKTVLQFSETSTGFVQDPSWRKSYSKSRKQMCLCCAQWLRFLLKEKAFIFSWNGGVRGVSGKSKVSIIPCFTQNTSFITLLLLDLRSIAFAATESSNIIIIHTDAWMPFRILFQINRFRKSFDPV